VRTSALRLCLRKMSTGIKDRFGKHSRTVFCANLNEINSLTAPTATRRCAHGDDEGAAAEANHQSESPRRVRDAPA
jgi:hypothetical protein